MTKPVKMTNAEFKAAAEAQDVGGLRNTVFKCTVCGDLQNFQDFLDAGADRDAANKALGRSCIGRYTGGKINFASEPGKGGRGCDYTMSGFIPVPGIVITDPTEGQGSLGFHLATPEEAQEHVAAQQGGWRDPNGRVT